MMINGYDASLFFFFMMDRSQEMLHTDGDSVHCPAHICSAHITCSFSFFVASAGRLLSLEDFGGGVVVGKAYLCPDLHLMRNLP